MQGESVDFSYELTGGIALRPVQESDAEPLAAAFTANRAHLAPWEPVRAEEFFTVEGQQEVLRKRRAELRAGTALPMVLTQGGSIAGLLTLSSMVRGAFQNAHLGYWLSRELQGNGFIPTLIMVGRRAVQSNHRRPRGQQKAAAP